MRILAADDEPVILELLQMVLLRDGHTVKAVTNGRQALENFETDTFDVIITDGTMPELDGVSLAKQIKATNPDQKIVLLSGSGIERHLSVYFDAVLTKPVQFPILQALLKRLTRV
jgi:CheY-like chemotaxis protein